MAEKGAMVKAAPSKARKVRTVLVQAAQGARRRLKKSGREDSLKSMAISGAMGYAIGYAKQNKMLEKLPLSASMGQEESLALIAAGAFLFTGNKWAESAADTAIAIVGYKRAMNTGAAKTRGPGAAPLIAGEEVDLSGVEEIGGVEVLD